jgi:hypothetical protein
VKALDEENLERLLQLHLQIVRVFFNVLINITWPIPFKIVYCCI